MVYCADGTKWGWWKLLSQYCVSHVWVEIKINDFLDLIEFCRLICANNPVNCDRKRTFNSENIFKFWIFAKKLIYFKEIIPETTGKIAHVTNIIVVCLIPIVCIHLRGASFSLMGSSFVCFLYCILFVKLWSYVQVNLWCRTYQKQQKASISGKRRESFSIAEFERKQQRNEESDQNIPNGHAEQQHQVTELVQYPDNLNLHDLFYFLCAPTLCYELNFPRTTRIRKRFLIKRILEVVVGKIKS